MRFFLISDNSDAMNGLRLAGIEGTVADLRNALEMAAQQPDIAVLLVTEKIAETYTATLDSARAAGGPLLITVPSTGGGAAGKDRLTRYIREAIGVKI
jgi:V/A-type H+-transporting ATPase subunit F